MKSLLYCLQTFIAYKTLLLTNLCCLQTFIAYKPNRHVEPWLSAVVDSNKQPTKIYCFVAQTLLNMFRALQCPSSGARQTAVAASGFRMNVEMEVFSADHG